MLLKNVVLGQGTDPQSIESITLDKEKLKNLQNLIINGLKPDKWFKKYASNAWQQKYLKNNYTGVAKDLMNAKVQDIEDLAKIVVDSFENVAGIAKSMATAQSNVNKATKPSTGTEQTTVTQPGASSKITEPSGPATTEKPSSESKKIAVKTAKEVYKSLHDRFGDIPEETVEKIIAVLALNDMIKQ
jgi:hypothetical protein